MSRIGFVKNLSGYRTYSNNLNIEWRPLTEYSCLLIIGQFNFQLNYLFSPGFFLLTNLFICRTGYSASTNRSSDLQGISINWCVGSNLRDFNPFTACPQLIICRHIGTRYTLSDRNNSCFYHELNSSCNTGRFFWAFLLNLVAYIWGFEQLVQSGLTEKIMHSVYFIFRNEASELTVLWSIRMFLFLWIH